MAKDTKPAEELGDAPPKKSKKLLIIILAAVLAIAIGGGAAVFLLKSSSHDEAEDEEVAEETAKPAKKKEKKKDPAAPPIFVGMEPFTVNLIPETGDQYLQVVLSIELETAEDQVHFNQLIPKIRNNITLLLSGKKASELLPKEGKEKLASDIRDEINTLLNPPVKNKKGEMIAPDGPVSAVLFTSFIIQ